MNRISSWFWFIFLCSLTLFGTVGVISAAENEKLSRSKTSEQSPALKQETSAFKQAKTVSPKKVKPAAITFSRQPEDIGYLTFEPVTPITSRLPSFQSKLSDIPANVSYIPANVSYKTSGELNDANPRTFQDSVRDIEGAIFYDQVGNDLDTTFSLRGFSNGSSVIVLVDGVRVNEVDGDSVNYPLIPMNDVEYIQIDRGSASPIYGSGAFAGVVNVITRKPSHKRVSLFGGTELSSFKGIKFNQGINGSIPDHLTPFQGRFTYYFNGGRDLNDGFRDNGDWRITSFDMKSGYELPEDNGAIHVGVKNIQDAISNPGALTVPEFHADQEQTTNPLDGRKFRNTIVQIDADKKFLDHRLVTSTLASLRVNQIHFYTTSRTFPDGAFNPDTDLVTTRSKAFDLIGQLGYEDKWKWLGTQSQFGVELKKATEYDLQQDAFQGVVVQGMAFETERNAKPKSAAIFWRETLKFWDRIIVHGGMRHDFDWLRTRDFVNQQNNLSRRWNDSSISTGLTLKPVRFMDLFSNYSQGFRVPTISEIAPFSSGIATDLNPEKTNSYEAGTRLRYKNLAQTKLSFFLIDLKNEIVFDSTSITSTTPFGKNTNIGQSRRDGLETRLDLMPLPGFNAYGSYTWTQAYVRETTGSGVPFHGSNLGLVPKSRFTMGGAIRPLIRLGVPFDGLRIAIDGTYTGRQFVQSHESESQSLVQAAGETIDAYMIWNTILSFEWKGKQIYFKINNVFDRQYYSRAVAATNFGSSITASGSHLFVNPGPPREFLLGMKWEFDS